MTQFINDDKRYPRKTVITETVFTHVVCKNAALSSRTIFKPKSFDTVYYLGRDSQYGDVFQAFSEDTNDFTLYLGRIGDEFK